MRTLGILAVLAIGAAVGTSVHAAPLGNVGTTASMASSSTATDVEPVNYYRYRRGHSYGYGSRVFIVPRVYGFYSGPRHFGGYRHYRHY